MADNETHELDDNELEKILMKSEAKTGELKSKFSKLGLDDLQNFSTQNESVYEWNGQNFQKKEFKGLQSKDSNGNFNWISLAKRERKSNYSVDGYYREVLQTGGRGTSGSNGSTSNEHEYDLKAPKHITLYDHQFYDEELHKILELEWAYYKRVCKIPAKKEKHKSEEDVEVEQSFIDHARPLTKQEEEVKQKLLSRGYGNWTRRDFYAFISANVKHSRYDIEGIASEFDDKTYEEVKEYSEKFWTNYRDIENYDRYVGQIEYGEEKLRKVHVQMEALRRKVAAYEYPMRDMEFKLPYTAISKREWSDYEDRWLVVQMLRLGINNENVYEQIFNEIQYGNSVAVELDFWLQGRNVQEIARRCQTLLGAILKEHENAVKARLEAKAKRQALRAAKSKPAAKSSKSKAAKSKAADAKKAGKAKPRPKVNNGRITKGKR